MTCLATSASSDGRETSYVKLSSHQSYAKHESEGDRTGCTGFSKVSQKSPGRLRVGLYLLIIWTTRRNDTLGILQRKLPLRTEFEQAYNGSMNSDATVLSASLSRATDTIGSEVPSQILRIYYLSTSFSSLLTLRIAGA